jgi:NAD(P)-dependent dehydrogenase (short-subunit alcohol dehydrogenase family)
VTDDPGLATPAAVGSLADTVAIVTGGASGIGASTARMLARRGASVVVADLNNADGELVVSTIASGGGTAVFTKCDVSQATDVEHLIASTVEQFGRLDGLVANAGIQIEKALVETTDADWDRVIDINLRGTFLCARAAVRQMVKTGGGVIVATGSVLSLAAEPNLAAYCASKGGILMLVRSIATDYGRFNIRANCVCPGYINTPLGDSYFDRHDDPTTARREAENLHLLGRLGETDEVAACIAFLLSEDASFITGSALVVDGGLLARI